MDLPADRKSRILLVALGLLAAVGSVTLGRQAGVFLARFLPAIGVQTPPGPPLAARPRIPVSCLPGPPRDETRTFSLSAANARRMIGRNDPFNERWADVAGNYYTDDFDSRFNYEQTAPDGPRAWVRVETRGATFAGRLEARGLKPNFAYQMKLRGSFADRRSFEAIGRCGRWRLPGRDTNYTDADYAAYAHKEAVEAYILFDYFVTDANGDAVRDFSLDASLHVLWNANRQRYEGVDDAHLMRVAIDASDSTVYARPKPATDTEYIWAERERCRYRTPDSPIRLPVGRYRATLVLTEESFHSTERDGGWWATVLSLPVEFEIGL